MVATIAPQVQESELRRVLRKRPESLDAYECVLRGLDLMYRFEGDSSAGAEDVRTRDGARSEIRDGARAGGGLVQRADHQGVSPESGRQHRGGPAGRLALTLDRFDPLALSLCGHVRAFLFRDYDHAIELFDRALAANPSSAIAWLRSSATFS